MASGSSSPKSFQNRRSGRDLSTAAPLWERDWCPDGVVSVRSWLSCYSPRVDSQQQSGGRERRAYPRATFYTEVWLGQDGVFTRTNDRLSNVSLGGAFIETPQGYAVGSILSLRFALSSSFVTATAIVRNARLGEGIGVEFLDLSPENSERLEAFIGGQR